MDNGMDYYGEQNMYGYDQPLYDYEQPLYPTEPIAVQPAEHYAEQNEPVELPPEPEDSPYDDPIVRHILTLKDDDYRNRMLSYLNENVTAKPVLHPVYVMLALVLCFPVGLCMMYFGTRWGTFAKVVITIFTLLTALAIYEILASSGTIPLPSLIDTISYIFSGQNG